MSRSGSLAHLTLPSVPKHVSASDAISKALELGTIQITVNADVVGNASPLVPLIQKWKGISSWKRIPKNIAPLVSNGFYRMARIFVAQLAVGFPFAICILTNSRAGVAPVRQETNLPESSVRIAGARQDAPGDHSVDKGSEFYLDTASAPCR